MARRFPAFSAVAEQALLVEFGDKIAPEIHARVLRLDRALAAQPVAGFIEATPAYTALLIRFDPLLTDHGAVETAVQRLLDTPDTARPPAKVREVLVCYDADLAPDLAAVAAARTAARAAALFLQRIARE